MVGLLIAGIGVVIIGVLTIIYGIPIKEFSFGNTMILTGATVASSGLLLLGLWVVAREIKALAQRLGPATGIVRPLAEPSAASAELSHADAGRDAAVAISGESKHDANETTASGESTAPSTAGSGDPGGAGSDLTPEPPPVKPRRNLLFSSSSKRERERAAARAAEKASADQALLKTAEPAVPAPEALPQPSFETAWPMNESPKAESSFRRSLRPSPEAAAAGSERTEASTVRREPTPPAEAATVVTILKAGVVDGMAYSLYSDGSIEAQMSEGMVRFASIDELRAHLDQRP